jgi:hypothetical protein
LAFAAFRSLDSEPDDHWADRGRPKKNDECADCCTGGADDGDNSKSAQRRHGPNLHQMSTQRRFNALLGLRKRTDTECVQNGDQPIGGLHWPKIA